MSEESNVGRPTIYSEQIASEICERISDGKSLRSITSDTRMPGMTAVCKWLADGEHEDFAKQYARAREIQADTLADEILQIADDAENDTYTDKDGNQRTDYEAVNRSRLRVDARKWYASKVAPKKYGDKLTHAGDPDAPIEHNVNLRPQLTPEQWLQAHGIEPVKTVEE